MEMQLRRVALVLGAVLLVQLLYSGGRLWLQAPPEPIAPAPSSLQFELPGSTVDEPQNQQQSQAVLSRPLFWAGRSPYVPVAKPEPVAPPPEPGPDTSTIDDLELLGVYAAGRESGIIVSHKDQRLRLRLDESIGGWKFTLMSADGAVFQSGRESRTLQLEHAYPEGKGAGRAKAVPVRGREGQSGGDSQ